MIGSRLTTLVALLSILAAASRAAAQDTIVVCPDAFREALAPWVAHRSRQGYKIDVVSNRASREDLRRHIRNTAAERKLRAVVLVGDADPAMVASAEVRARCVPTYHMRARINVRFGSEPEIATDNWYADLDDDDLPDVPIGRLTADTPAELSRMVRKIIAYEKSADFSLWRRQINLVAGVGGFGVIADSVLEGATKTIVAGGIPPSYQTSMTYASWRSPYCPDPREFRNVTLRRLNEGCLFWIYIGHGNRRWLDEVRTPGGRYPILSTRDVPRLNGDNRAAVAIFLSCYAGAFDQPQDCLAEELLAEPGGPVAVVAGSRVTLPYAMALLSTGMLDECFKNRQSTLGGILLAAKQRMMQEQEKDGRRVLIDAIARWISPVKDDLQDERREHLHLFNLLGDPLLSIRHPREVEVSASSELAAGESLEVKFTSPIAGRAVIELAVRRDRLTFVPKPRIKHDRSESALAEYSRVYERANDPRLAGVKRTIEPGEHTLRLLVPQEAHGACHVRVFVEGREDFALGATGVYIHAKGGEQGVSR